MPAKKQKKAKSQREDIPIERYDARIVGGSIKYYAIGTDGKEYPMPDCYKEMYNDDYLVIRKKHMALPELFSEDLDADHYIPIRTAYP